MAHITTMRMRSEVLPVRGMRVGHFPVQVQSSPDQSRVHGPYFTTIYPSAVLHIPAVRGYSTRGSYSTLGYMPGAS